MRQQLPKIPVLVFKGNWSSSKLDFLLLEEMFNHNRKGEKIVFLGYNLFIWFIFFVVFEFKFFTLIFEGEGYFDFPRFWIPASDLAPFALHE